MNDTIYIWEMLKEIQTDIALVAQDVQHMREALEKEGILEMKEEASSYSITPKKE